MRRSGAPRSMTGEGEGGWGGRRGGMGWGEGKVKDGGRGWGG